MLIDIAVCLLLAALLAFGISAIVRGARGAAVLSEPHCARCGYDLRGSPNLDR